jgi:hypothetical protein
VQVVMSLDDEHALVQSLSHEPWQLALQSKLPGLVVHEVLQVPSQLPWQLGRVRLHPLEEHVASTWALQAIWRFGGEHWMSHDALASTVQLALPSTTAPPQSSKMLLAHAARAVLAANVSVAPATRARSEDQRNMRTS